MKRVVFIGLLWLLLAVPVARAEADRNDPVAEGAALFQVRCAGMCHQTPQAEHLSARQWKVVLGTMQRRMKQFGVTPMSEREFELIFQYVSAGAGK